MMKEGATDTEISKTLPVSTKLCETGEDLKAFLLPQEGERNTLTIS